MMRLKFPHGAAYATLRTPVLGPSAPPFLLSSTTPLPSEMSPFHLSLSPSLLRPHHWLLSLGQ